MIASIVFCLTSVLCFADGFRFDPETQEVWEDNIRLKLAPSQTAEISSTGMITFSGQQLSIIRRLYPSASVKQKVYAATFNDNREDYEISVHVFWVRPDEVAITLPAEILANRGDAAKAMPEPLAVPPNPRELRLSPEGSIFHMGKPVDERKAIRIIGELNSPERPGDYVGFTIVVPPPFKPSFQRPVPDATEANEKVREILARLEAFGKSRGVMVSKGW